MNPFYVIIIGVGIIMVYVGFKGSQHNLVNTFKSLGGQSPSSSSSGNTAKGVQTTPAGNTQQQVTAL